MAEQGLTHIDENGAARMVDVSAKAITERIAIAEGFIAMAPETLAMIVEDRAAKGDVFAAARIAGIMASKRTSELIPLCHPLAMEKSTIDIAPVFEGEREDGRVGVHVEATCKITAKTGIEIEALTACSIACLTIYDMCKAVDRGMEIGEIRLLKKDGGRSGLWQRG
jgi:cyclic pyranopterin monophosphate synthase